MNALYILDAAAIDVIDAVVILGLLLAGLVCIAVIERRVAQSPAGQPAYSGVDLAVLLERLAVSLRIYVRATLMDNPGRFLPWLASILSVACGVVGFAVLSFGPSVRLANLNTGVLIIFGASFLGVIGGVLARGFSASSASLAGLARNAMRVASFEVAAALALLSGIILAGSISVKQVVEAQLDQGAWFFFLAPIGFFLYLASSIAGIDSAARPSSGAPIHRHLGAEGESAFRWPFGSLGASIHVLIEGGLATTLFLGGWLRPFASFRDHFAGTSVEILDALPPLTMAATAAYCFRAAARDSDSGWRQIMRIVGGVSAGLAAILAGVLFAPQTALAGVHGAFWFLAKMVACIYAFLWLRAHLPRLRFGRPIRAAWNFLIPLSAINAAAVAAALVARQRWDWSPASSTFLATAAALAFAVWFGLHDISETAENSAYGVERS